MANSLWLNSSKQLVMKGGVLCLNPSCPCGASCSGCLVTPSKMRITIANVPVSGFLTLPCCAADWDGVFDCPNVGGTYSCAYFTSFTLCSGYYGAILATISGSTLVIELIISSAAMTATPSGSSPFSPNDTSPTGNVCVVYIWTVNFTGFDCATFPETAATFTSASFSGACGGNCALNDPGMTVDGQPIP